VQMRTTRRSFSLGASDILGVNSGVGFYGEVRPFTALVPTKQNEVKDKYAR
jgi:hypothetical protein